MQPPPLSLAPRRPASAGFALLAIAATLPRFVGADIEPLVLDIRAWHGEPWRMLSCVFPHGDLLHLLFNVFWTWTLGSAIEERLGSFQAAGLFALFGGAAGTIDWVLAEGGIGLSGVGYGTWALLAVASRRSLRFAGTMDTSTSQLFVIWFFLCIVLTGMGIMRVANVAHAMGAVFGALTGLALTSPRLASVAVGAVAALLVALPAVEGPRLRRVLNVLGDRSHLSAVSAYHGTRALEQNRNDTALALLEDAVHFAPGDAGAWWNLSIALQRAGAQEEATKAFSRALALDPGIAARIMGDAQR